MSLPREIAGELERKLGTISRIEPVRGGCVSSAVRLVGGAESFFLKYERHAPPDFFTAEAEGLERMRSAVRGLLRIPGVVEVGESDGGWSWLVLEWLEPAARGTGFDDQLGAGVATLHRQTAADWGLERDGYIGSLPQPNGTAASWPEFWWKRRLSPQLESACEAGLLQRSGVWARLEKKIPDLLGEADADGPSTLHGDLWSGNVMATAEGPALVDPASYRGHREVDLAMARLFGGFGKSFFEVYAAQWPLRRGHQVRLGVYQLYYLLVHVNLFGAAYVARTNDTLARVLAAPEP